MRLKMCVVPAAPWHRPVSITGLGNERLAVRRARATVCHAGCSQAWGADSSATERRVAVAPGQAGQVPRPVLRGCHDG